MSSHVIQSASRSVAIGLFTTIVIQTAPAAAYEIEVINRPWRGPTYHDDAQPGWRPMRRRVAPAPDIIEDEWVDDPPVMPAPRAARRAAKMAGGYAPPSAVPIVELGERAASLATGDILIDTASRRLYLIGEGQALRYAIGVGRNGFSWTGVHKITAKKKWPGWTPPEEMKQRRPDLPDFMPGGPDNPLGARALYLGSTLYRIHGSNEPETIGRAVSSGCFRMTNPDVADLYGRVQVGAKVIVR